MSGDDLFLLASAGWGGLLILVTIVSLLVARSRAKKGTQSSDCADVRVNDTAFEREFAVHPRAA